MHNYYLKVNNMALHLPINPSDVTFKYEVSIDRYEIIGLGEISEFNSDKLVETQINSFIPRENTNLITNSSISAKTFVNELNKARKQGQVIELIIRRDTLDNIALNCYIGTLRVTEKGGEVGDVYYEISLIEWRPHNVQVVDIQQPAPIQITVPVETSGSEYIANVTAMTQTQKSTANQQEEMNKNPSLVDMLKARDRAKINELNSRASASAEIVKGNRVIVNGKGSTLNKISKTYGGMITYKTFNNAKGIVESIMPSGDYRYGVKISSNLGMKFYFSKSSLKKEYSGGGGTR